MANFKGGFAFNNEAAKVEVEQSPNGALISCINPVTGESMGGGNPNSVQVIEGNGANPWGDVSTSDLYEAILSGNANATLLMSSVYGTFNQNIFATLGELRVEGCYATESTAQGYSAHWMADSGNLTDLKQIGINNGSGTITDLFNFSTDISTTLTIYRHPMP